MSEHVVRMTAVAGQLPKLDKEKIKELNQLSEDVPMEKIQKLINGWEKKEFLEFKESETRAESHTVDI